MKKSIKYLYILAVMFMPLFTACNEDDDYVEGESQKTGTDIYDLDGKVQTLQTATIGNGINIILMGDGFTAADISAGTYDEVMDKTMEALFSTQPMKGLREYFNVYSIQKVSVSNLMNGQTALGSVTNGDLISGKPTFDALDGKTLLYASLVPGYDVNNTYIGVVMNTEAVGGITSYPNGWSSLACAYCTLYGTIDSDEFRQTITHELVGHGIGKLADEYVPRDGQYSGDDIDTFYYGQYTLGGWYQNIDMYGDITSEWCFWSDFAADTRYAAEGLDMYLIAYDTYYGYPVYSATSTSIMKDVSTPGMTFNAPSRRAIYNSVMLTATGQTPTYEEFVAFDQANL